MILEDFLAKLGASTRITVGVSVSPGLGIEMIEVDRVTGTVNKYAHRPLEYNYSTREISDYNQFQTSLEALFEELHIPKKSNIILSLPNVHFGLISLPLLLTDEAITNAIISEVEQSYIFKRQEPIVSWTEIYSNVDTENRTLAYTAIQKPSLDGIIEACNEVGCTVSGVENSYASLLRALQYAGLTKEQMKESITWNLMIIGQNSYSILSMVDKKVMEYYEEPLALKSFVDDEIYNAITTSAQLTLSSLPASHLYIVSETDLVSAEVLSIKLPIESSIKFLECNKYTQNEILPTNLNILPKLAMQVSLEAIGASTYPFCDFPLKLNLVKENEGSASSSESIGYPRINLGNIEIELTPDFIKKLSLLLGGILILPMFLISLWLGHFFIPQEQAKLSEINAKIQQTTTEIAKYSQNSGGDAFNLKDSTEKIMTQNKAKLNYYSALGMSTPNKLWITYYNSNESGKIDIKGKASNVESVYTFYKNLKQLVNNSGVRLYKLEIASDSIDAMVSSTSSPSSYDFEITDMTESELNPPAAGPAAPDAAGTAATTTPTTETKSGFEFGKPLFGPKNTQPGGASTTPSAPAAPAPAPTNQTTPGGDQLPKNLQKIEKF